jgi:hypothetical protein
VLVGGVRTAAFGAETVEHGHPERADEVAVRAAGDGRLGELQTELASMLPCTSEERGGTRGALERRPRPAAVQDQARIGALGAERP